jgi:hypothetical protein
MISATHAHTGPQLARRGLEGSMAEIARRYADELPRLIAESVRLAQSRLEAARVSAGAGREASLSFNRRFFMKDGSVGWNPGKLNPNIVRPAGPIDSDVPVVLFESAQGKPLATYLNFAMHLDTVGGTRISADYPCTLSALLGRVKGEGMLTLFTIGAAGNVNHIDVSSRGPQKGDEEAARIGTVLAGEVLKTYTRLTPVEASSILGRSETVSLPIPELPPGELEKAREVAPRYGKPNAAPFLDLVRAFRALDVASREGRPLAAEIQVITLGHQIAWVGLPGEIFVELGMAVKRASPFRHTIVVELANGNVGYVPDRKAYDEGAYEVVSARCAPGSGELMVATSLKLLRTLHSR